MGSTFEICFSSDAVGPELFVHVTESEASLITFDRKSTERSGLVAFGPYEALISGRRFGPRHTRCRRDLSSSDRRRLGLSCKYRSRCHVGRGCDGVLAGDYFR